MDGRPVWRMGALSQRYTMKSQTGRMKSILLDRLFYEPLGAAKLFSFLPTVYQKYKSMCLPFSAATDSKEHDSELNQTLNYCPIKQ